MLVMGGAKSGKSTLALNVCSQMDRHRIFLATAQAWDEEMKERIRRHRKERDKTWSTVEEPVALIEKIREYDGAHTVILLDCLTLWLSNLFGIHQTEPECITEKIDALAEQLKLVRGAVVLVSNDVGMGIVPENPLARQYRDAAGYANQRIASLCRKVVVTFAGLPLVLKDE